MWAHKLSMKSTPIEKHLIIIEIVLFYNEHLIGKTRAIISGKIDLNFVKRKVTFRPVVPKLFCCADHKKMF